MAATEWTVEQRKLFAMYESAAQLFDEKYLTDEAPRYAVADVAGDDCVVRVGCFVEPRGEVSVASPHEAV